MHNLSIRARDGHLGGVHDLFFEDDTWLTRYLVLDTGTWLPGRRVLVAPECAGPADWEAMELSVCLTRDQVKQAPDVDTEKPVDRQKELELRSYYNWPIYWSTPGTADPLLAPGYPGFVLPAEPPAEASKVDEDASRADPHLRSAREVTGYDIEAVDGGIGHVEDFLIDERTWRIRYLVVDTGGWLISGRRVVAPVEWVGLIDWSERQVFVELNREDVEHSPELTAESLADPDFADRVDEHYAGIRAFCDPDSHACQPILGP